MLIALTGLHCAGKSYFTNNIPQKYGFEVVSKKDLVVQICKVETGREDGRTWFREEYKKNPYAMVEKILNYLPKDKNVVLDAVHSNVEWDIISQIMPSALIAMFVTPQNVREKRWYAKTDVKMDEENNKRIGYWHSDNGSGPKCLLTQVEWAFNGESSLETNEKSFQDLIEYMNQRNNKLGMGSQKEILPVSDDAKLLQTLMLESARLTKQLADIETQIKIAQTKSK